MKCTVASVLELTILFHYFFSVCVYGWVFVLFCVLFCVLSLICALERILNNETTMDKIHFS